MCVSNWAPPHSSVCLLWARLRERFLESHSHSCPAGLDMCPVSWEEARLRAIGCSSRAARLAGVEPRESWDLSFLPSQARED